MGKSVSRQGDCVVVCERCKGRGYHHGFGERGHDPDWCVDCGGCGSWVSGPDGDDASDDRERAIFEAHAMDDE